MPEMHSKHTGFTWNPCSLFTKIKERLKNFKDTGGSKCIDQKELSKTCFQIDMTYGDFKDLNRRTAADKVLCDKAFNIVRNSKYDEYQHEFASMVNKFLIKRTSGRTVKNEIISNKELAEELHKPIIRTFTQRKVHLFFIDRIWGADLQLIIKFNRGCSFLLCDIDIITNIHGFFL